MFILFYADKSKRLLNTAILLDENKILVNTAILMDENKNSLNTAILMDESKNPESPVTGRLIDITKYTVHDIIAACG